MPSSVNIVHKLPVISSLGLISHLIPTVGMGIDKPPAIAVDMSIDKLPAVRSRYEH